MEAIVAIRTRRSVRAFEPVPVPREVLSELVGVAMYAPSAGNQQPWQLVLIDDRQTLDNLSRINPYGGAAKVAPAGVMICGDTSHERFPGFWVQDCSALTQNLLLAIHSKGLGAVWTGVYPLDERVRGARVVLGLPEHVIPMALVLLGTPSRKTQEAEDRVRPDRIHWNHW
ncbi:MAG: nitroreductase family protein [Myxococcota bacterium]|jgi:nitroreductase|nr:nitroreductase family protein [Myxococcota bacterium]